MLNKLKKAGQDMRRAVTHTATAAVSLPGARRSPTASSEALHPQTSLPLPIQPSDSSLNPIITTDSDAANLPECMIKGTQFTKVSERKGQTREILLQVDMSQLRILWESKTKAEPFLDIETIKEIRLADDITALNKTNATFNTKEHRERAFAIVYTTKGQRKILTLIAQDKLTHEQWVQGLNQLFEKFHSVGALWALNRQQTLMKRFWFRFDKSRANKLDYDTLLKLATYMNLPYSKKELVERFKKKDPENVGWLDFGAFYDVLADLDHRDDLKAIFAALSKDDITGMKLSEFTDFIRSIQKVNILSYILHNDLDACS